LNIHNGVYTVDAFQLMIQVDTSIVLSLLLNAKKDRPIFMSTCVTKWKALIII